MAKQSVKRPRAERAAARSSRESVALVPEAERIEKEPEADFFVSIPRSKKKALKTYCVMQGISMREWLLQVMQDKGIGVEGTDLETTSEQHG